MSKMWFGIFIFGSVWIFSTSLAEEDFVNAFERHVRSSVVTDFDEHTRAWVQQHGQKVQRHISWWDLYGNHHHLQERPQYRPYKVDVRMSSIQYGRVTRQTDKPQQVYSKWFCNNQKNQPLTTTISREIRRSEVFSWTVEKGLSIGKEIKVSANIPSILAVSASVSTQIDFRRQDNNVKEEAETFSIQYDLTVDPQTAVKADWVITEREVEIPFTADVFIDGYIAIWHDQKLNNHWLWFYPILDLAGGEFRRNGNGLVYTTRGVFRGVRGVKSVIDTKEFQVREGSCEPAPAAPPSKHIALELPLKMSGLVHGDE